MTTTWDDYEAARTETDAALARVQPRGYAMNSESRKRLAESQAELLAAADPHAWPESAELVELRATVARVRLLTERIEERLAGTSALDVLTVSTLVEADRCGYHDGLRFALRRINRALDGTR